MSILAPATKYNFAGIGQASATATFLALAATPYAGITQGIVGRITFFLLTRFFSMLASVGLVVLNVGIAQVETIAEQKEFDGSFDEAFKIINSSGALSKEQANAIDQKVISAFKHFAAFGSLK